MTGVSALNRTAILVADVVASGQFYSDVLGMTLLYTEAHTTAEILPQLVRLLGLPSEGVMRFRFYRSAEPGDGGLVALFEVTPAPPPVQIAAPERMSVGEACLVFFHPDLEALMAALVADGCRVVGPVEILLAPQGAQREAIVRNRDGTLFNFIERTRA